MPLRHKWAIPVTYGQAMADFLRHSAACMDVNMRYKNDLKRLQED